MINQGFNVILNSEELTKLCALHKTHNQDYALECHSDQMLTTVVKEVKKIDSYSSSELFEGVYNGTPLQFQFGFAIIGGSYCGSETEHKPVKNPGWISIRVWDGKIDVSKLERDVKKFYLNPLPETANSRR